MKIENYAIDMQSVSLVEETTISQSLDVVMKGFIQSDNQKIEQNGLLSQIDFAKHKKVLDQAPTPLSDLLRA